MQTIPTHPRAHLSRDSKLLDQFQLAVLLAPVVDSQEPVSVSNIQVPQSVLGWK